MTDNMPISLGVAFIIRWGRGEDNYKNHRLIHFSDMKTAGTATADFTNGTDWEGGGKPGMNLNSRTHKQINQPD